MKLAEQNAILETRGSNSYYIRTDKSFIFVINKDLKIQDEFRVYNFPECLNELEKLKLPLKVKIIGGEFKNSNNTQVLENLDLRLLKT